MKGLLRPHLEVHTSDQWPITGTVKSATKGAIPKIMDICVSLYPDLRSKGGIKVKATLEAISNPATTKLTRISLRSLTLAPGTLIEVGVVTFEFGGVAKLPRLLLQVEEFELDIYNILLNTASKTPAF